MADANTSPLIGVGSALTQDLKHAAQSVGDEAQKAAIGAWAKVRAWVVTTAQKFIDKAVVATHLPEGVVRMMLGALAVGATVLMLTAFLHRPAPAPKVKPEQPTVMVPQGAERFTKPQIKVEPTKAELELQKVNQVRQAKGASPLVRESLLDGEAMNVARKLLVLKGDPKSLSVPMSEVAAATYSKTQQLRGVGHADLDTVIAQWDKSPITGPKLADKSLDRVGIAYIHDDNTFWKDHWVMILAKSKK